MKERVVIGRDPACDLVVADEYASLRHALLFRKPDGSAWVRDLGALNRTRLNGLPVWDEMRVIPGDVLTVGRTHITVP